MRTVMILLLPALLLPACKGDEASARKPSEWPSFEQASAAPKKGAALPLPDACSLASADQVQTLLAEPAALMADDPENCMWSASSQPGRITMLMLQVSDTEDLDVAHSVFDGIAGQQGNVASMINAQLGEKTAKSGQEIEDLGDEAWLSAVSYGASFGPHGVGAQQLVVRKGTRLLTLNVTGSTRSDGLAQRLQDLARSAAARL